MAAKRSESDGDPNAPNDSGAPRRSVFPSILPTLHRTLNSGLVRSYVDVICIGKQAMAVYLNAEETLKKTLPLASLANSLKTAEEDAQHDFLSVLNCQRCNGFLMEPVSLPCGHSLCNSCTEKVVVTVGILRRQLIECPSCQQRCAFRAPGQTGCERRSSVLLSKIWNCSFPQKRKAHESKEEGNTFATEKDFPLAIESYTEALLADPLDHRVLGNRSRAYLVVGCYEQALKDALDCCILNPLWNKGHFRRGAVLEALGRRTEAASAYLLCLHLGAGDGGVRKKVCQLLKTILEDQSGSKEERRQALAQELICMCSQDMETFIQDYHMFKPRLMEPLSQLRVDDGDLDCVLCASLLLNPVTTFCGHTFCRSCLCRSFDHTPLCPVCRSSLAETFELQLCGKMVADRLTESVAKHCFTEAYLRKMVAEKTEKEKQKLIGLSGAVPISIFPCTVAFPGMPCPLHVFEPRYRMLIRRCVESSRRFGICGGHSEQDDSFNEYGTILFIKSVEYTADGRSLVTTVGEKRFRVIQQWKEDGLHQARVEYLEDEEIREEELEAVKQLQREVFVHAKAWAGSLPPRIKVCLEQSVCCPVPACATAEEVEPHGPQWLWWFVSAMPVAEGKKIEFLQCRSLVVRLELLRNTLPLPEQK